MSTKAAKPAAFHAGCGGEVRHLEVKLHRSLVTEVGEIDGERIIIEEIYEPAIKSMEWYDCLKCMELIDVTQIKQRRPRESKPVVVDDTNQQSIQTDNNEPIDVEVIA